MRIEKREFPLQLMEVDQILTEKQAKILNNSHENVKKLKVIIDTGYR